MSRIAPNVTHMSKGKTHTGAASFNCGDTVATTLEGWPLANVRNLAEYLDIEVSKYDHLNPGHQRMVMGTIFRRMVKDQNTNHDQDSKLPDGDSWFKDVAKQFEPDYEELESTIRERAKAKMVEERERKKAEREAAKAAKAAEREAAKAAA